MICSRPIYLTILHNCYIYGLDRAVTDVILELPEYVVKHTTGVLPSSTSTSTSTSTSRSIASTGSDVKALPGTSPPIHGDIYDDYVDNVDKENKEDNDDNKDGQAVWPGGRWWKRISEPQPKA